MSKRDKIKKNKELKITFSANPAFTVLILVGVILLLGVLTSVAGLQANRSVEQNKTEAENQKITSSPTINSTPTPLLNGVNKKQEQTSLKSIVIPGGTTVLCLTDRYDEINSVINRFNDKKKELDDSLKRWVDGSIIDCRKLSDYALNSCKDKEKTYNVFLNCENEAIKTSRECLDKSKIKANSLAEENKKALETYLNSMKSIVNQYCRIPQN